jgi:diaminopimelate decarboxylase
MIVFNEFDPQAFVATAELLFGLVAELSARLEISFEFVNLGGGIGIFY